MLLEAMALSIAVYANTKPSESLNPSAFPSADPFIFKNLVIILQYASSGGVASNLLAQRSFVFVNLYGKCLSLCRSSVY